MSEVCVKFSIMQADRLGWVQIKQSKSKFKTIAWPLDTAGRGG